MQQVGKNEKIVLVKLTKSTPQFFDQNLCANVCGWDAGDVGNILNKYVFHTVNPGIAAQQKR